MSEKPLQLIYLGPFRVCAPDGNDITPNSMRARALLAILGTDTRSPRSRNWLQSKLWSQSADSKGSASLRQCLTDIRRAFGPHKAALRATRHEVQLDPTMVRADIDTLSPGPDTDVLEGLDVPDHEFEDWLRDFRARMHAAPTELLPVSPSPKQAGLTIFSRVGDARGQIARVNAGLVADHIAQSLEDGLGATQLATDINRGDIDICVNTTEDSTQALITAKVVYIPSNRVLFSDHRIMTKTPDNLLSEATLAEFAHSVSSRTIARLPFVADPDRDEIVALGFGELGKRRLFSYDPANLHTAKDLFRRAFDADPGGIFLAWQAFLCTSTVIEGMRELTPELREETNALLRRAIELSPESAQVHGIAALVHLLQFDDPDGGLRAAETAVRRNPHGLFPRQALAMTAGAHGDTEKAYAASSFCRPGLRNDDARHLWDLYHGLVCISTNRLEEAQGALIEAVRHCPNFKAPLRQLIGLNVAKGDLDAARRNVRDLRCLEPDFSLDRFSLDPDYPVSTLRSKGLLERPLQQLQG